MEAWQLALLAWEGLKLLVVLGGAAGDMTKPADPATVCYQEVVAEGPAFCPRDITGFTLPDPADHWMVRR